jgi:hypothetical protein
MPASRSVVPVLLRSWETFLYSPQGRPCGRPHAAAVLGRQHLDGFPGQPYPAAEPPPLNP